MHITTDLLDAIGGISKSSVTKSVTPNNDKLKTHNEDNFSFTDILEKVSSDKKNSCKSKNANISNINKSKETKKDDITVFCLNAESVSKEALVFLEQLDTALNSNSNIDDIKGLLEKLNSILDGKSDILAMTLAVFDFNQEMQANGSDISQSVELNPDDLLSIALDKMESIDGKLSELFKGNMVSLDGKLSELFKGDTVSLDGATEYTEFLEKFIMSEMQGKDNLENNVLNKKEDNVFALNNLDISLVSNSLLNTVESNVGYTKDIHPLAKQVLANIQGQLESIDLSNKTIEIRLKLYPSKLGEICVVIERCNDSVRVKLLSDNAEVRGILTESIQHLELKLNKNSDCAVNIDVSQDNGNYNSSNGGNQQRQENNKTDFTDFKNYFEDVTLKVASDTNLANKILDISL